MSEQSEERIPPLHKTEADDQKVNDRREFILKLGRYAVFTAPVVNQLFAEKAHASPNATVI